MGSLEVGQQQADKHRALLLLTHKSADPKITIGRQLSKKASEETKRKVFGAFTHLERMLSSLATCTRNFFLLSLSVLRTTPLRYPSRGEI